MKDIPRYKFTTEALSDTEVNLTIHGKSGKNIFYIHLDYHITDSIEQLNVIFDSITDANIYVYFPIDSEVAVKFLSQNNSSSNRITLTEPMSYKRDISICTGGLDDYLIQGVIKLTLCDCNINTLMLYTNVYSYLRFQSGKVNFLICSDDYDIITYQNFEVCYNSRECISFKQCYIFLEKDVYFERINYKYVQKSFSANENLKKELSKSIPYLI